MPQRYSDKETCILPYKPEELQDVFSEALNALQE